jgi:hypothetical protein
LIEVARRRPASLAALAQIPGIGRSKLERYGTAVIGMVAARPAQPCPGEPQPASADPENQAGR